MNKIETMTTLDLMVAPFNFATLLNSRKTELNESHNNLEYGENTFGNLLLPNQNEDTLFDNLIPVKAVGEAPTGTVG